jgi:ABC-type polysaccharide/polyol phosphate transport system ATPase subunit
MSIIELQQASLTFHVRLLGRITLKDYLLAAFCGKKIDVPWEVRALRNVNLSFAAHDRVGVIGHNGAGKSTLLKVIAGIYPLTEGKRSVQGQITSLFDFAVGFHGDLTGWQNILLRGVLHRQTPRSIRAKMPAIAEFSELGRFLDLPLRCYSAGMIFRLGFSIATVMEPDILLIDEVFSVGDLSFQSKVTQRIEEMLSRARLIIMVNHDLRVLARLCHTGVWLDQGEVRQVGPIQEIIAAYEHHIAQSKRHRESPRQDGRLPPASGEEGISSLVA